MRSRLSAAFVYAAVLGIWAARLGAQEQPVPEMLKDRALAVRFQAIASEVAGAEKWEEQSVRYTVPGSPVGLKLVGSNLVIVLQVTPFDKDKDGVILVAQGQIWVRKENGELSYRTAMETLPLKYGERVLFFPLGREPDGSSRVRLEIVVERYREPLPATKPALNPPPTEATEGDAEVPKPPEQSPAPVKPKK